MIFGESGRVSGGCICREGGNAVLRGLLPWKLLSSQVTIVPSSSKYYYLSSLKSVNLVRFLEISSEETNLFPPLTNQNHLQNTPAGLQYPKP